MPFSVYTKLGLPALQSTRMTLELANCSLCVPKGIARDVLVPVGRLTFPADFVVVDFECDYRVPLIFGRPFLRTARVLIDVHGEELVIRDGMERIVFKPAGRQGHDPYLKEKREALMSKVRVSASAYSSWCPIEPGELPDLFLIGWTMADAKKTPGQSVPTNSHLMQ
ncbi:reverse transcriptase domain-containing protein [Tanacetum coccineum]